MPAATPEQLAALVEESIDRLEAMFERRRAAGKCGLYRIRSIHVASQVVDPAATAVLTQTTRNTPIAESVSTDEETASTTQQDSTVQSSNDSQNGGIRISAGVTDGTLGVLPDFPEILPPAAPIPNPVMLAPAWPPPDIFAE